MLISLSVAPASGTIPTTSETSFVYDGQTYSLNAAHPVGYFADGSPFIVSDGAGSFTQLGTASASGANGAMKNPFNSTEQGFDTFMATGSWNGTSVIPYNAALNVDPSVGTASWGAGEKASFVKAIRQSGAVATDAVIIEKYHTITILDTAPPSGALRPGMAGTSKPIRTRSQVSYTSRGIAAPSGLQTPTYLLGVVPSHIGIFGHNGELRRRSRLDVANYDVTNYTTNDNYSAEIVKAYSQLVYHLHTTSPTSEQRTEIENKIILFANDIESLIEAGWRENATRGNLAGQGGCVWLWLMAAASITGDVGYLNAANTAILQPVGNGFWVTSEDVGLDVPGGSGVAAQTFFDEHIGIPWATPDEQGSHHGERYFHTAAHILGWEQATILMMNAGPTGFSDGLAMILDNGANNSTNQRAAVLNFLARRRTWNVNFASSYPADSTWKNAWDAAISANSLTLWTGEPDQPPGAEIINQNNPYFSAGTGSVTLNTRSVSDGYATEAVTQIDMGYSLDNVQWVEDLNITLSSGTYTKTGLLRGAPHWCRWRMQSASGASVWSPTFPYNTPVDDGDHRERVTPTGTVTAAIPDYTGGTQPIIHSLASGGWDYEVWEPASATLGLDDVRLAAGVGYIGSGYPAPTYAFQWKRGGTDIVGATSQLYTRVAADAGASLTCEITATNASGSDVVTTAAVTAPAITTVPAATLIDTQFGPSFAIDYATELAGIAPIATATVAHAPYNKTYTTGNQMTLGAINCSRGPSGNYGFRLDCKNTAQVSTTYNATLKIVMVDDEGPLEIDVRNGANVSVLDGGMKTIADGVASSRNEEFTVTDTITVGPSETDLDFEIFLRFAAGTGGTSFYLSGVTIAEV